MGLYWQLWFTCDALSRGMYMRLAWVCSVCIRQLILREERRSTLLLSALNMSQLYFVRKYRDKMKLWSSSWWVHEDDRRIAVVYSCRWMMYVCAVNTPHETNMAAKERGILSFRNWLGRTRIPFCNKICLHKSPARLAENVSVNAPKLDPIASAYTAPSRVRDEIGELLVSSIEIQSWMTRASKIVAPIFVPQICSNTHRSL